MTYVPDAGDLVWFTFDPQVGREQAGRRPALIISPRGYNAKSGLALVCPITSRVKGYSFEVFLPAGSPVRGVILADQVKSADWKERRASWIGTCPAAVFEDTLDRMAHLLGGPETLGQIGS